VPLVEVQYPREIGGIAVVGIIVTDVTNPQVVYIDENVKIKTSRGEFTLRQICEEIEGCKLRGAITQEELEEWARQNGVDLGDVKFRGHHTIFGENADPVLVGTRQFSEAEVSLRDILENPDVFRPIAQTDGTRTEAELVFTDTVPESETSIPPVETPRPDPRTAVFPSFEECRAAFGDGACRQLPDGQYVHQDSEKLLQRAPAAEPPVDADRPATLEEAVTRCQRPGSGCTVSAIPVWGTDGRIRAWKVSLSDPEIPIDSPRGRQIALEFGYDGPLDVDRPAPVPRAAPLTPADETARPEPEVRAPLRTPAEETPRDTDTRGPRRVTEETLREPRGVTPESRPSATNPTSNPFGSPSINSLLAWLANLMRLMNLLQPATPQTISPVPATQPTSSPAVYPVSQTMGSQPPAPSNTLGHMTGVDMEKMFETLKQPETKLTGTPFSLPTINAIQKIAETLTENEGISITLNPAQPKFGQSVQIQWSSNGWISPETVRCEAYFNDILLGSGGKSGFAQTLETYVPITVDLECSSAKDKAVTIHIPISTDPTKPAPSTENAQLLPVPNVSTDSPVFKGGLTLNTTHIHIGDSSPEVSKLQTFLAKDPLIYPEGKVTGYVDEATVNAIARFQKVCKIDPPSGWIGEWYGCAGPRTIPALKNGCQIQGQGTPTKLWPAIDF
jgi:hypothetical protein